MELYNDPILHKITRSPGYLTGLPDVSLHTWYFRGSEHLCNFLRNAKNSPPRGRVVCRRHKYMENCQQIGSDWNHEMFKLQLLKLATQLDVMYNNQQKNTSKKPSSIVQHKKWTNKKKHKFWSVETSPLRSRSDVEFDALKPDGKCDEPNVLPPRKLNH